MKKLKHPIDDFFREALKDHQIIPSEETKKAFLRDAMQIHLPEKKGRKGLILFSSLLAIIGAVMIIWAVSPGKSTSTPGRESNPTNIKAIALNQVATPVNKIIANDKTKQPGTSITEASDNKRQPAHRQSAAGSKNLPLQKVTTQKNRPPQVPATNPVLPGQTDGVPTRTQFSSTSNTEVMDGNTAGIIAPGTIKSGDDQITVPGQVQSSEPADPLSVQPNPDSTISEQDSVIPPVSGVTGKITDATKKNSQWIPSIGIYYTPEWMFNTLEGTKFVNNFGIEGTFHFGRFSVRTGAGLSIAKGTNELVVAYNDYMGAYNKLDSMEFTWNNPTQEYIPKFYMSNQDVWDSLMKLDYARVVNRYTYLQIPMIMGYELWQSERISVGLRAGPVMSILLASKQLSAAYDPGTKRIISINDIAPEQVSLNWQVMGGLYGSFRLTETLSIEIEPGIRYYFNSVYEKPVNNTKPWSVGIRGAFVIKF